jgi:hypothetical protein
MIPVIGEANGTIFGKLRKYLGYTEHRYWAMRIYFGKYQV